MPRLAALRRRFAVLGLGLMIGSLASCGQVGPLFLRMPPGVEFPDQAPIYVGKLTPIFLPEGVTLPAPVSATRPIPVVATPLAPASATSKLPSVATSIPPASVTQP